MAKNNNYVKFDDLAPKKRLTHICEICKKKCLTARGLLKHKNAYHKDNERDFEEELECY